MKNTTEWSPVVKIGGSKMLNPTRNLRIAAHQKRYIEFAKGDIFARLARDGTNDIICQLLLPPCGFWVGFIL